MSLDIFNCEQRIRRSRPTPSSPPPRPPLPPQACRRTPPTATCTWVASCSTPAAAPRSASCSSRPSAPSWATRSCCRPPASGSCAPSATSSSTTWCVRRAGRAGGGGGGREDGGLCPLVEQAGRPHCIPSASSPTRADHLVQGPRRGPPDEQALYLPQDVEPAVPPCAASCLLFPRTLSHHPPPLSLPLLPSRHEAGQDVLGVRHPRAQALHRVQ